MIEEQKQSFFKSLFGDFFDTKFWSILIIGFLIGIFTSLFAFYDYTNRDKFSGIAQDTIYVTTTISTKDEVSFSPKFKILFVDSSKSINTKSAILNTYSNEAIRQVNNYYFSEFNLMYTTILNNVSLYASDELKKQKIYIVSAQLININDLKYKANLVLDELEIAKLNKIYRKAKLDTQQVITNRTKKLELLYKINKDTLDNDSINKFIKKIK